MKDELLNCGKNENSHLRGLNIVIINAINGKIELAKAFNTYKSSEAFDDFTCIEFPDGSIIVAAYEDVSSDQYIVKNRLARSKIAEEENPLNH